MKEILEASIGRRQLLANAGIGVAGLSLAGLLAGCGGSGSSSSSSSTSNDTAVLNFALNLEYLEAEFYSYALTGAGIDPTLFTGVGTQGATTGGSQVTFSDSATQAIAQEIAADELAHVKLLRSALGNQAIAKPAINLNALGIGFGSQAQFLTLSRAFEDTGVSAYGGAAYLLSTAVLTTAAQILGVEAYHAGNIRLLIAQQSIPTTQTDASDILPPPSGTHYFTNDPTTGALAVTRTTRQVLNIVYAGGTSSGGFFPAGLNGSIVS